MLFSLCPFIRYFLVSKPIFYAPLIGAFFIWFNLIKINYKAQKKIKKNALFFSLFKLCKYLLLEKGK